MRGFSLEFEKRKGKGGKKRGNSSKVRDLSLILEKRDREFLKRVCFVTEI